MVVYGVWSGVGYGGMFKNLLFDIIKLNIFYIILGMMNMVIIMIKQANQLCHILMKKS